jgi:O-antigen ligase
MSRRTPRAQRNSTGRSSRSAGKHSASKDRAYTSSESRILDFLASIPAMIVILITLRELFLAVTDSSMSKEQYTTYPELFQFGNFIIIIIGIIYVILSNMVPTKKKPLLQRNPEFLFFGCFLILMALSTLINGIDDKAIHGLPYRNQGIFHFALYILIYYFVSARTKLMQIRKFVLVTFLFTADVLGITAIGHQFFINIAAYTGKKGLSAIFFNSNHYGYFLVMALMVGVTAYVVGDQAWVQLLGLASGLLNMIVLFINNTFGAILGAFVSLLVVLVLALIKLPRSRWRAVSVAALIIALPLASGLLLNSQFENFVILVRDIGKILSGSEDAGSAGTNRWGQWVKAVEYIREKPLLGFGCEGTAARMMAEIGVANPHNEILTYALFFGVPAAVCYTLGVLLIFLRHLLGAAWKDPYALMAFSAALAYFISSLFGVAMFYTTPFFFIMLGYSTGTGKRAKSQPKHAKARRPRQGKHSR